MAVGSLLGTMHVPGLAGVAHAGFTGRPASGTPSHGQGNGDLACLLVFRGRGWGTPKQKVELLYGGSPLQTVPKGGASSYLCPLACPVGDPSLRTWRTVQNKMGLKPRYGRSGLATPTTTIAGHGIVKGRSTSGPWITATYSTDPGRDPLYLPLLAGVPEFGADLYRFDDARSRARPLSRDGDGPTP